MNLKAEKSTKVNVLEYFFLQLIFDFVVIFLLESNTEDNSVVVIVFPDHRAPR